jgi:ribosome-binding factor A
MSRRQERVGELIRDQLGEIMQRELRDPRLGGVVSITEVVVSPDLKFARVYLSVLGDEAERRLALKAARAAAGFLRHELGSRTSLRYVPELHFEPDRAIEHGDRVAQILKAVLPEGAGTGGEGSPESPSPAAE